MAGDETVNKTHAFGEGDLGSIPVVSTATDIFSACKLLWIIAKWVNVKHI